MQTTTHPVRHAKRPAEPIEANTFVRLDPDDETAVRPAPGRMREDGGRWFPQHPIFGVAGAAGEPGGEEIEVHADGCPSPAEGAVLLRLGDRFPSHWIGGEFVNPGDPLMADSYSRGVPAGPDEARGAVALVRGKAGETIPVRVCPRGRTG